MNARQTAVLSLLQGTKFWKNKKIFLMALRFYMRNWRQKKPSTFPLRQGVYFKPEKVVIIRLHKPEKSLYQLECDISNLKNGKPIMSYLADIDVEPVEVPMMCLLSVRKMVRADHFADEYRICFGRLSHRIKKENLFHVIFCICKAQSRQNVQSRMDMNVPVHCLRYMQQALHRLRKKNSRYRRT